MTQWIMDWEIARTVDFLIISLWIVLDGVFITSAQRLRAIGSQRLHVLSSLISNSSAFFLLVLLRTCVHKRNLFLFAQCFM